MNITVNLKFPGIESNYTCVVKVERLSDLIDHFNDVTSFKSDDSDHELAVTPEVVLTATIVSLVIHPGGTTLTLVSRG